MKKSGDKDRAVTWMNAQSRLMAEKLLAVLRHECEEALAGVPLELVQAIHTRALEEVLRAVRRGGADLASGQYLLELDGGHGEAAGRAKPGRGAGKGTRRKRSAPSEEPPSTDDVAPPTRDADSQETFMELPDAMQEA